MGIEYTNLNNFKISLCIEEDCLTVIYLEEFEEFSSQKIRTNISHCRV